MTNTAKAAKPAQHSEGNDMARVIAINEELAVLVREAGYSIESIEPSKGTGSYLIYSKIKPEKIAGRIVLGMVADEDNRELKNDERLVAMLREQGRRVYP